MNSQKDEDENDFLMHLDVESSLHRRIGDYLSNSSPSRAKPLVVNGQKAANVHQTEILEAALRRIGKDPDVVRQEFSDYVQGKAKG